MLKRVLILEDNTAALDYISALIHETGANSKTYQCTNIKDAYQTALEKDIDLFIVDIILDANRPGDSSGLKFVENIRKLDKYTISPVIFVTSLEDARLHSYEKLHCYSFLEKPFDPERLKEMVRLCIQGGRRNRERRTLYFRKDGIIIAIDRDEIVEVEGSGHVLYVRTNRGERIDVPYITIKRFLEEADDDNFIQCSRSSVVNLQYVRSLDLTNRMIELKNDFGTIGVGMSYKKKLKDKIG